MAQTYLGTLVHTNHSSNDLGKQAFGVLQVLTRRISGYQSFSRLARTNVRFVQPQKQKDRFVLVSQDFVESERPEINHHVGYRVARLKKSISRRLEPLLGKKPAKKKKRPKNENGLKK
ncbi:MAG: hypothetical protein Q7R47_06540 [Candidatus Diapherotrites archaeon]|nr:hypothetical protein [Candidatus Diapherotrites archaeon]